MSTTTLINCRKKNLQKLGYQSLEHWLESDPDHHIYIGRNMSFYVPGAKKSKFANPFSVKKYGRDECLRLYQEYILTNPELYDALHELKDCTLACWCSPDPCHGDILIKLINELK